MDEVVVQTRVTTRVKTSACDLCNLLSLSIINRRRNDRSHGTKGVNVRPISPVTPGADSKIAQLTATVTPVIVIEIKILSLDTLVSTKNHSLNDGSVFLMRSSSLVSDGTMQIPTAPIIKYI
jgi:hypothetical protein